MAKTAARWWKASASNNNSACVEVGDLGTAVGVRDTKDREGPHLTVSQSAFQAFIEAVKAGRIAR